MKGEFKHPVERMLTALYGWLVLRMRKEEVSLETEAAMVAIREMANSLAKGHIRIYSGQS
jgi:very-short-patch-repair endonuclease